MEFLILIQYLLMRQANVFFLVDNFLKERCTHNLLLHHLTDCFKFRNILKKIY